MEMSVSEVICLHQAVVIVPSHQWYVQTVSRALLPQICAKVSILGQLLVLLSSWRES